LAPAKLAPTQSKDPYSTAALIRLLVSACASFAYESAVTFDHGISGDMKEVAISVFKAKCLGILEEVRKTGKPIRVTRLGKPVAEVVPPSPVTTKGRRLGCMVGTGRIVGDIVGSISDESEWDATR